MSRALAAQCRTRVRWQVLARSGLTSAQCLQWLEAEPPPSVDVSHVPIDLPLNRGVMAADGFHPGEPVYRVCGVALAEHNASVVWPRLDRRAS